MKEVFYEETAELIDKEGPARRYNIFKTFSWIFYALSVIYCFVSVFILTKDYFSTGNVFLNILVFLIPLLIFIASGIFCTAFKNRFYIEYDYTLVSGSLRFSKVIKNVKRKGVFSFECTEIAKIGKVDTNEYAKLSYSPEVKIYKLTQNKTPMEGKNFYYILANNVGVKKGLITIECTETFIQNLKVFVSYGVIEKGTI